MGIRAERRKRRQELTEQKKQAVFIQKKVTITKTSMFEVCKLCNKHQVNGDYSVCSIKARKPFYISDGSNYFIQSLIYQNVDVKCLCERMTYIMLKILRK